MTPHRHVFRIDGDQLRCDCGVSFDDAFAEIMGTATISGPDATNVAADILESLGFKMPEPRT